MVRQLLIKDGKLQINASGELLIIPDGESASYCACCGGFSCPSGDPHLEVTISWTSDPTDNSGWDAGTGKLSMFGETWASGETKNICPTDYHHGQHATKTSYNTAKWQRTSTAAASSILFTHTIKDGTYRITMSEKVLTRDADKFDWHGIATSAFGSWFLQTYTNHNNAASITGAGTGVVYTDLTAGISFDQFDGSFKATSDGITIQWQKSAAFP
jgi:hypothetical protein